MHMEKRKIVIISAVCAFVLLAGGAYYLFRPVFKVHSTRTTQAITTGDLNYMSYSTPDAEKLDILIVSLKRYRRLQTFSTDDFTLSYRDLNTKSWIDLGCNGLNPLGSRHGEGDMSWMLAGPNQKVDITSKGSVLSKYISLAFIVPIHLQNATLKYRGKVISKITRIHKESTEEIKELTPIVPSESLTQEGDTVYTEIPFGDIGNSKASFQGGNAQDVFEGWVRDNLIYPPKVLKKEISGFVMVQFVVNKKGDVTDVKIRHGVDPSLDKEIIRVVMSSPKWVPAKIGDRAVNQQFEILVRTSPK